MTPESLSIDGDRYISTKEAAALTGYTSDYVGQLARKDKFGSVLVGKARLVDKEELLAYVCKNGNSKQKERAEKEEQSIPKSTEQVKEQPDELEQEIQREPNGLRVEDIVLSREGGLAPVQLRTLALIAVVSVYLLSFGIFYSLGNSSTLVAVLRDSAPASTGAILEYTERLYCSVLNLLGPFGIDGCVQDGMRVVSEQEMSREALVVVPGTGDEDTAAAIRARIEETFSDEVLVLPNEDARSGVIQPVFRDSSEQEYLYMLVPVGG